MAGVADYSIFKNKFSHHQIIQNDYRNFELQLFTLELNSSLLIALLYRHPKCNTEFLNEFCRYFG